MISLAFLDFNNYTPVAFYPYSHMVSNRILSIDCSRDYDKFFLYLRRNLNNYFNAYGIDCSIDNKTVYAIDYNGVKLFIGFYDFDFSIGLSVKKLY